MKCKSGKMNHPNPHFNINNNNNNNNNNDNNNNKKKGGKKSKKRKAVTPPLPLPLPLTTTVTTTVKEEEELLPTRTRQVYGSDVEEEEEEEDELLLLLLSQGEGKGEGEGEEYYTKCRDEVLRRRSKRLKKLAKVYRHYYWCLIEELKTKHLQYIWNRGTTPFPNSYYDYAYGKTPTPTLTPTSTTNIPNNINGGKRCDVHSCKKKAMALTRFCHSHIIFDPNQLLYKPCSYPTKCSPSGPTLCMKPILKSAVPSLCSSHLEKAEKHLSRCLRKEGFNALGTNRHPPKLNVVVAEFVRQIQSNRRENL